MGNISEFWSCVFTCTRLVLCILWNVAPDIYFQRLFFIYHLSYFDNFISSQLIRQKRVLTYLFWVRAPKNPPSLAQKVSHSIHLFSGLIKWSFNPFLPEKYQFNLLHYLSSDVLLETQEYKLNPNPCIYNLKLSMPLILYFGMRFYMHPPIRLLYQNSLQLNYIQNLYLNICFHWDISTDQNRHKFLKFWRRVTWLRERRYLEYL